MSTPHNDLRNAAEELAKRFDSFALVVRVADENNNDYVLTTWHGPWSDVMGLSSLLKVRTDTVERVRFEAEMDTEEDVPADEL